MSRTDSGAFRNQAEADSIEEGEEEEELEETEENVFSDEPVDDTGKPTGEQND